MLNLQANCCRLSLTNAARRRAAIAPSPSSHSHRQRRLPPTVLAASPRNRDHINESPLPATIAPQPSRLLSSCRMKSDQGQAHYCPRWGRGRQEEGEWRGRTQAVGCRGVPLVVVTASLSPFRPHSQPSARSSSSAPFASSRGPRRRRRRRRRGNRFFPLCYLRLGVAPHPISATADLRSVPSLHPP